MHVTPLSLRNPAAEYIHKVIDKGYNVRKIFYNVEYTEFEKNKLNELTELLEKRNIALPSR